METPELDEKLSVTNREGNIFEVPSNQLISSLHNQDNRIVYFPYVPQLELNLDHNWFFENVGALLAKQVLRDFPDQKTIYARAIACSLNGPMNYGDIHVKDIREVVNTGNEQEKRTTVTTGAIGHYNNGELMTDWMIWLYLFKGARELRSRLPEELARNIFPALLVYNEQARAKILNYHTISESDRATLVSRAYILPYLGYKR